MQVAEVVLATIRILRAWAAPEVVVMVLGILIAILLLDTMAYQTLVEVEVELVVQEVELELAALAALES
jgi:hypothetical protein